MRTTLRFLLLVCIGVVLTQLVTWVIGWFAAMPFWADRPLQQRPGRLKRPATWNMVFHALS